MRMLGYIGAWLLCQSQVDFKRFSGRSFGALIMTSQAFWLGHLGVDNLNVVRSIAWQAGSWFLFHFLAPRPSVLPRLRVMPRRLMLSKVGCGWNSWWKCRCRNQFFPGRHKNLEHRFSRCQINGHARRTPIETRKKLLRRNTTRKGQPKTEHSSRARNSRTRDDEQTPSPRNISIVSVAVLTAATMR